MRTRFMLPLAILLLTAFLTMGIAAAAERPETVPLESLEEEAVSSTSGEALFAFVLPPITSVALTEEDMGSGVDNRQDH